MSLFASEPIQALGPSQSLGETVKLAIFDQTEETNGRSIAVIVLNTQDEVATKQSAAIKINMTDGMAEAYTDTLGTVRSVFFGHPLDLIERLKEPIFQPNVHALKCTWDFYVLRLQIEHAGRAAIKKSDGIIIEPAIPAGVVLTGLRRSIGPREEIPSSIWATPELVIDWRRSLIRIEDDSWSNVKVKILGAPERAAANIKKERVDTCQERLLGLMGPAPGELRPRDPKPKEECFQEMKSAIGGLMRSEFNRAWDSAIENVCSKYQNARWGKPGPTRGRRRKG